MFPNVQVSSRFPPNKTPLSMSECVNSALRLPAWRFIQGGIPRIGSRFIMTMYHHDFHVDLSY